jgi:hypothetical protein
MSSESVRGGTYRACDGNGNPPAALQPPAHRSPTPQPEKPEAADKPYSVFTHREKWLIVIIASYAALFRLVYSYHAYY